MSAAKRSAKFRFVRGLKSPSLNSRDSYLRDGVKGSCVPRVSPKSDATNERPRPSIPGCTTQVQQNTLTVDSPRTLRRIAVNLVTFIHRLTNVSIEEGDKEKRAKRWKKKPKKTRPGKREYNTWTREKFSQHINRFTHRCVSKATEDGFIFGKLRFFAIDTAD